MILVVMRILSLFLNILYFFIKLIPVKNKIVLISRQSNEVNLDFMLLKNQLEKKYQVICLCNTLDGGVKSKIKNRIKYGLVMLKQMYHLATSKVCILDSYCPTVSMLKHKKSLTIIQMWHSIGTMKKFGYAILNKEDKSYNKLTKIMKMHKNYDVVFASSDAYKSHLASGFGIEENKIIEMTLPRVDLLLDKKYEKKIKKEIFSIYPMLKEKKNIVYCPTFRKDETKTNRAIERLIKNIDFKKYNFILKLHPLTNLSLDNKNVIYDKSFSSFDMLFVADICISDYSCIIYEAGVRNIPLYFYNYDFNYYKSSRGLAIDYKELPGYTERSAVKIIKSFEKDYDFKYLRKFIRKYVKNTKKCTEKIVEEIEKYM